jgi:hypothetical protein
MDSSPASSESDDYDSKMISWLTHTVDEIDPAVYLDFRLLLLDILLHKQEQCCLGKYNTIRDGRQIIKEGSIPQRQKALWTKTDEDANNMMLRHSSTADEDVVTESNLSTSGYD